jgi:Domain of unknown function (DUF4333)
MRLGLVARFAAAGVSLLLLVGCTKTLDTPKLESTLKADIERQAKVSIRSIACPRDVKPKKGDTFTCAILASDGSKHHVKVSQTDDQGHVRYAVTD